MCPPFMPLPPKDDFHQLGFNRPVSTRLQSNSKLEGLSLKLGKSEAENLLKLVYLFKRDLQIWHWPFNSLKKFFFFMNPIIREVVFEIIIVNIFTLCCHRPLETCKEFSIMTTLNLILKVSIWYGKKWSNNVTGFCLFYRRIHCNGNAFFENFLILYPPWNATITVDHDPPPFSYCCVKFMAHSILLRRITNILEAFI